MIEINNLSKHYGDKAALTDVSFSVKKGEIVGLIGKNGAGKSTILKSISGLLHYDSGSIFYDGIDCAESSEVIQDFGILIDCAFLDYINAYDNLRLLLRLDNKLTQQRIRHIIDDAFSLVGLSDVKYKRVKTYSFGMKQRLGLAQAIINARTFIVLDEPFIGLDPIGKEIAKAAILKKAKVDGYAVLFSSHDLEDVAEICDKIVMIDQGKCIYNDVMRRQIEYHIFLQKSSQIRDLALECSELGIDHVLYADNVLSFVDDEKSPKVDTVLKLIHPYSPITKIETSTNMLKGMFIEEVHE